MPNRINTSVVNEYRFRFGQAPDLVAVDIHKLSVAEFENFRDQARAQHMNVFVVKTSLARLVLREATKSHSVDSTDQAVDSVIDGPTALVWGGEGLPDVVKLVDKLGRKQNKLAVRGGLFEKAVVSSGEVLKFKNIPDRPTLLAQVLGTIIAPLTHSLGAINALLSSPAALTEALIHKQGGEPKAVS